MEQQTPGPEAPSLALSDLVALLNITRLAAERGAVRVEEMSAVGAVYDKLVVFLKASGVINQPQVAQPETPTEE